MKKTKQSSLLLAVGTTIISGFSITSVQAENTNPFVITELSEGYMQLAKAKIDDKGMGKMEEGACGEGKCGSNMMKGAEEKNVEGNCAGNKPMPKIPKIDKPSEGKCGEGKCGDKKPS